MALFSYFPNYIWNLSVAIALESGGRIGEIVDMCQPIKDAADSGADAGTPQFMAQWAAMGEKLIVLAGEDQALGRAFSASDKLERAALYLFVAERMQGHGHPGRAETYGKAREAFDRSTSLGKINRQRVEIPLETGMMPALYTCAPGDGPQPVVVYCNGLDSSKELLYWSRLPEALARRGISTLCVDQPGTGEALRLQDLPATAHSEEWASKAVDWLEGRPEVDPARIGMTGISLGGHFAPRAVAYEPRFASGACWGANHNWAEVQQKRLNREGENPVPHYWDHVMWVFGASDMEDFHRKSADMDMGGHMDRITVPFLVTHGANDRQISVDYAHQAYQQLINSPRRELKIFTDREGGVEHVGADNMSYGRDYIADWFAETLGGPYGMTEAGIAPLTEQLAAARYVARETIISAVINAAISVGFFVLVFGGLDRVPVRGMGNYAFDFLPQSFAIGLMGSLVPGLLARKAIAAGRIPGGVRQIPSPARIVLRSLLNAVAALAIGGGLCAAALWLSGADAIGQGAAFVLKVIYGAALGAVITRVTLSRLIGQGAA